MGEGLGAMRGALGTAIGCLPAERFIWLMGRISAAAAAAAAPARREVCGLGCMRLSTVFKTFAFEYTRGRLAACPN